MSWRRDEWTPAVRAAGLATSQPLRAPPHLRILRDRGRCVAVRARAVHGHERRADRPHLRPPAARLDRPDTGCNEHCSSPRRRRHERRQRTTPNRPYRPSRPDQRTRCRARDVLTDREVPLGGGGVGPVHENAAAGDPESDPPEVSPRDGSRTHKDALIEWHESLGQRRLGTERALPHPRPEYESPVCGAFPHRGAEIRTRDL